MSEQKILVTFDSNTADARRIADHMRIAALALALPTEENASELFRIGAEAVFLAAELRREREAVTPAESRP